MHIVVVVVGAIVVLVVLSWSLTWFLTRMAKRPPGEWAEKAAPETEEVAPLVKCPNCGAPQERRETVCSQCGTTYASEEMLALHQLEFLLAETDGWVERLPADLIEELRQPYAKRLTDLRARLIPKPAPAAPPPTVEEVVVPAEVVPAAPPPPKAERVPFDEWLLSERNIKIALYSGAVLLVMAALSSSAAGGASSGDRRSSPSCCWPPACSTWAATCSTSGRDCAWGA